MADIMEFSNTMKEFIDKIIEKLEELPTIAINRYKGGAFGNYVGTNHYIDKRKTIDAINEFAEEYINTSTDTASEWIAFTQRELNEEEKEHYGNKIKYMLDCKLPEEDEEILVTYKWKDELYVDNDTFLRDGSECYLDSGREFITEAIAWRPLPQPYQEEGGENDNN